MAERVSPWRSKPPQEVVDLLQQVGTVQLFLVQRPGPTSFLVREEGSEVKRKVQIGSRINCSCCPVGANGTCKELCLHILFVMVKVLRVPVSNPLLWQLSLSDRELEEVLRCSMQPERPPQDAARAKPAAEKTPAGQVKRKEIDEEDPCPICYEDMVGQDMDNLVWCRFGCGRNVHGKCMGVWMEHQVQSLGKELTCPLCRSEWGDFKWRPPPPKRKAREERKDVHYGTHCGACKKAPLVGKRFRCLICADFDLCEGCFTGGHHPQHPFAVKDTPKSFGAPAERPTMMPTALPIARVAAPPAGGGGGSAAAAAFGPASPRLANAYLSQRTQSYNYLLEASSGSAAAADGGAEGEAPHGEVEVGPAERRGSGSGLAGGGGAGGVRDALAVGVVGQQQQQQQHHTTPPRQGGGAGSRHPVRGTTVARAGGAGRGATEEHPSPPSLEARLAAQRRPLLAVEGLTVGPGGVAAAATAAAGAAASGAPGAHDLSDMLVRRAALGQPSRPVLVRRTRSTVTHDRPAGEGALGGTGPSAELNLGLAGVPLNAGGERSLHGEAPGPGPGSMATAACRQQQQQPVAGMPPRHPPRPNGQLPHRPGMSARPHPHPPQPHISAVAWAHPSGPGAAAAAPPPPDLVLQGRVVLHGEGGSPGPVGRPPPPPQGTAAHGGAGPPHGVLTQQQSVGVRCRGPPPRYVPPPDHAQTGGLRRSHSAGTQGPMGLGLAVTARSMAPHPLTPETPAAVIPMPPMPPSPPSPPHPVAATLSLPGNLHGAGPYGAAPYGNEMYGGAIQYDDNVLLAFTHHIPGPAASFRDEELEGGWLLANDEQRPSRGAGAGGWGGGSDGEYGSGGGDAQEEFPRGPASPSLHLFSSRPNTVPSELVSDLCGEPRGMSRSHSHSFTHTLNGRGSSRMGLGLSRGGDGGAEGGSPDRSPLAPVVTSAALASPRFSRGSARLGSAAGGSIGDVGRDSVLLASVRVDAVDDWMDSMRQQRQQRPSRDGMSRASTAQSPRAAAPPVPLPPLGPEDSLMGPAVNSSISGAAALAAARLSAAHAVTAGEEPPGLLGAVGGEASPAVALSASFEDTLTTFMLEQRMGTQQPPPKADHADAAFTTYGNPVFNRPYTLDMSFQQ